MPDQAYDSQAYDSQAYHSPAYDAHDQDPRRAFMLRVAGLPIETVRALRCPASRRWAQTVLAEEERLRAAGERVGDLLHDLVGRTDDGADAAPGEAADRRALLKLRREVFNNRLPARPGAALALVAGRDAATGEALSRWLLDRRELAELRSEGAELLAGESAGARAALRGIAGEERLRKGLLLASPTLDAQLDAYLRQGADGRHDTRPDKRRRKIERSLLSYLYRTVCKKIGRASCRERVFALV